MFFFATTDRPLEEPLIKWIAANEQSIIFGWWGLFGLAYTPFALFQNLCGGERRTVAEVLRDIHHPKQAPTWAHGSTPVVLYGMVGMFAIAIVVVGLMIVVAKLSHHAG